MRGRKNERNRPQGQRKFSVVGTTTIGLTPIREPSLIPHKSVSWFPILHTHTIEVKIQRSLTSRTGDGALTGDRMSGTLTVKRRNTVPHMNGVVERFTAGVGHCPASSSDGGSPTLPDCPAGARLLAPPIKITAPSNPHDPAISRHPPRSTQPHAPKCASHHAHITTATTLAAIQNPTNKPNHTHAHPAKPSKCQPSLTHNEDSAPPPPKVPATTRT